MKCRSLPQCTRAAHVVPLCVRTLCKAADTLTAPSRPSARTRQERHKAEFPGAVDIGDMQQNAEIYGRATSAHRQSRMPVAYAAMCAGRSQ
jgi:hypothetical protein